MSKKVLHIQAYGDVENVQAVGVDDWGIVSLKSFVDKVNAFGPADEIVVHIHSRGGNVYEGFAIHDYLRGLKVPITTIGEGLVASIATVLLLAGDTRQLTSNSTFMIHNPAWGDPEGGTADELQKAADEIRQVENRIVDFYVQKTGAGRDQIAKMMSEETFLKPETALEMKFATAIVQDTKAKAYASLTKLPNTNPKPNPPMSKALIDKLNSLFKKEGIKAEIKVDEAAAPNVVNLDLKIKGDEKPLHVQTDAAEPAIGDPVMYDGSATPDATYEIEDGRKIKTNAESKISEITAAPAAAAPAAAAPAAAAPADTTAKDAEIADLKAKLAAANTRVDAQATQLTAVQAELATNKATMTKIEAGIDTLLTGTKSGSNPKGEDTRFRTRNEGVDNPTDVQSAIAAFKAKKEARQAAKSA